MIVWLNGAFGAGKTTLAEELRRRLPDALSFDPEHVGLLLRMSAPPPPTGDFQDLPAWRKTTAEFATTLHREYGQHVITPMTLVERSYQEEIFGHLASAGVPLLHVFLDVPADELRRRITDQVLDPYNPEADAQARAFRLRNVDRCVAARASLPAGTLVLSGDRHPPEELADQVLAAL
ncbi:adenylylsulfate kinase-like enzyme [Saccharothrix saharensis]|uniref:Adenylylsulfate kinase-like enzyme n=1 Tax=Saccharothrix saharensis TaxID=571190 RepID=A0A543J9S8_9PSEU|nr:AAA family ATPase [Saccharothrix saharensis]TQM79566.1 adenylylsulfate kinase-like enzyme [Saccharothrix saharensis]